MATQTKNWVFGTTDNIQYELYFCERSNALVLFIVKTTGIELGDGTVLHQCFVNFYTTWSTLHIITSNYLTWKKKSKKKTNNSNNNLMTWSNKSLGFEQNGFIFGVQPFVAICNVWATKPQTQFRSSSQV